MNGIKNLVFLAAMVGSNAPAFARGGIGSEGEAKLLLGLLAVFALGGLIIWLEKEFPSFFPSVGGLIIVGFVSTTIAQIAESVGLVQGWGTAVVAAVSFVAILIGPALTDRGPRK